MLASAAAATVNSEPAQSRTQVVACRGMMRRQDHSRVRPARSTGHRPKAKRKRERHSDSQADNSSAFLFAEGMLAVFIDRTVNPGDGHGQGPVCSVAAKLAYSWI